MGESHYYVHDNGRRPFKITVIHDYVRVYRLQNGTYELIHSLKPERIFIGRCPSTNETLDGNTVLLKMDGGRYLFIGSTMFSFRPSSEIQEYVSPVGNSDVPYPYAVDVDGRYYLLIEDVVVENIPSGSDPYDVYYKEHLITEDFGRNPPRKPTLVFRGIAGYRIGQEPYTLTYTPRPADNYDRLIPNWGNEMHIEGADGEYQLLTKKDYINLMVEFGHQKGFHAMDDVKIMYSLAR